jgi:hypothetical protein
MASPTVVPLKAPTKIENLTVVTGEDRRYPMYLQVYDVDGALQDLDVSSCTFALRVVADRGGTALISGGTTTSYSTSGIKVQDAAAGEVDLVLAAADIAALTEGVRYEYAVKITTPAGQAYIPSLTYVALQGTLYCQADV